MSELCLTMNGIPYALFDDQSYSATVSNSGNASGKAKYKTAWANAGALSDYLLSANSNVTFNLTIGAMHPLSSSLFATDVVISPLGPGRTDNGVPVWDMATLDVSFKPLNFNPTSPAVIRETNIKVIAELYPISGQVIKFAGNTNGTPQRPDRELNFQIQYMVYSVTLKNQSSVSMAGVCNAFGKVGSGNFTVRVGSNIYSIAGDQVLYNGIDNLKSQYTSSSASSVQRFDVTHNFFLSPISLQKEFNPAATGDTMFDRFQETVPKKYQTYNLSTLGV